MQKKKWKKNCIFTATTLRRRAITKKTSAAPRKNHQTLPVTSYGVPPSTQSECKTSSSFFVVVVVAKNAATFPLKSLFLALIAVTLKGIEAIPLQLVKVYLYENFKSCSSTRVQLLWNDSNDSSNNNKMLLL